MTGEHVLSTGGNVTLRGAFFLFGNENAIKHGLMKLPEGGILTAESAPDFGTKVTILIPKGGKHVCDSGRR